MALTEEEIKELIEKNKDMFDALEEYDRTGKLPKLKKSEKEQKTGKPISRIIEERFWLFNWGHDWIELRVKDFVAGI